MDWQKIKEELEEWNMKDIAASEEIFFSAITAVETENQIGLLDCLTDYDIKGLKEIADKLQQSMINGGFTLEGCKLYRAPF